MNVAQLWTQRFQKFSRQYIYYLNAIGNSGFLFAVLVLLILGGYYYPQFLAWLPSSIPVIPIIALFLGWMITRGRHRTLIQEPDILYLTRLEWQMDKYFKKSFYYNWFIQGLGLLFITMVLAPLYQYKTGDSAKQTMILLVIMLALKGWNLSSSWKALKMQNKYHRQLHTVLRYVMNVLFLYGLFINHLLLLSLPLLLGMTIHLFDWQQRKNNGHPWYLLVRMDKQLTASFFRFAQLFVHVPATHQQIKKRKLLPSMTKWLPFTPAQSYRYLYLKKLFRSYDDWNILLRLTIIGALLVFVIPGIYGKMVVFLMILLSSGMQLRGFWTSFHRSFWFFMYPLPEEWKAKSFISTSFLIFVIQGLLIAIPLLTISPLLFVILSIATFILGVIFRTVIWSKQTANA